MIGVTRYMARVYRKRNEDHPFSWLSAPVYPCPAGARPVEWADARCRPASPSPPLAWPAPLAGLGWRERDLAGGPPAMARAGGAGPIHWQPGAGTEQGAPPNRRHQYRAVLS